jgi:hypothetical protein
MVNAWNPVVAFFATTEILFNSRLSKIFFNCREITDLSFSNNAAIWFRLNQKVSSSKRTSTRVVPSDTLKILI